MSLISEAAPLDFEEFLNQALTAGTGAGPSTTVGAEGATSCSSNFVRLDPS